MNTTDQQETEEQRFKREAIDRQIFWRILIEPDPYQKVEWHPNEVQVGGEWFSWLWILYYAQARNSGISCMQTSSGYAIKRLMNRAKFPRSEYRDIQDRDLDHELLFRAACYLRDHGLLKAKPVPEPEPAMAGGKG